MCTERKPYPKNRQARRPPVDHVCARCGKAFTAPASEPGIYCSHACYAAHKRRPVEENFWSHVEKTEKCWLWTGGRYHDGYGAFMIERGKLRRAHRIAWEWTNGPIPDGLLVCHDCPDGDNPLCVRPDHLFLGTHEDNMGDMACKRIGKEGPKTRLNLSPDAVREMRRRFDARETTIPELARLFDVHPKTAARIVKRQTYQHV